MMGTRRLLRLLLWFAFLAGFAVALWCMNFFMFHPGLLSSIALVAAVAWVGLTGGLLYIVWPRRWRPRH